MIKKIELTPEQYKNLLRLVYLGHWMSNSHRDDPIIELDNVENLVYSFAKDFGCDEMVDCDNKFNRFYPSFELESEMDTYIQEYDDYTFWDELAWHLADRDFDKKFDPAQTLVMTTDEILREKDAIVDKYYSEFDTNGVDNLILKKE
jgi:hypothetical protein